MRCLPLRGLLLAALFAVGKAAAAEFAHYPNSWFDATQTRGATAQAHGVTNLSVYGSNDRFDTVHAFYRQFLHDLPSAAAGRALFCLDAVASPGECRRFVELQDLSGAGVGTRITVYERR